MCTDPPRPPSARAAFSCALDVVWADRRWQRLHSPLGEVDNLARAVFLRPAAGWFFLDHQQVQVAVVAQLRSAAQRAAGGAQRPGPQGPAAAAPTEHGEPSAGAVHGAERWRSVVAELQARSPHFHRLWSGLHVRYRARTAYAVHHPDLGRITLDRFVDRAGDGSWREHLQAPGRSRAAQVLTLLDLL